MQMDVPYFNFINRDPTEEAQILPYMMADNKPANSAPPMLEEMREVQLPHTIRHRVNEGSMNSVRVISGLCRSYRESLTNV